MKLHPLKLISIISLLALMSTQLGLIAWTDNQAGKILGAVLAALLLIPLQGLIGDRRYTFKWIGFLTMLYIAVGISESFSTPELRLYGILTLCFSSLLFISSIYYSRFLR